LVAIDVEAAEENHAIITEVGIATLDTRNLRILTPGVDPLGSHWFDRIKGQHLRTAENLAVRNQFTGGDPSQFDFGESDIIPTNSLNKTVTAALKIPDPNNPGSFRKMVLIGHDISADLNFLSVVGFGPDEKAMVIDTLDTQRMWHSLHGGLADSRAISLKRLLSGTRISYQESSLHNAGNDAVYTMMGYIGVTLLEAIIRKELPKGPKDDAKKTSIHEESRKVDELD
jgi:hypothetical protein